MKPLRPKKKIKPDKPSKKPVKANVPETPAHIINHRKATMGRQEEQAACQVMHAGLVGSGDQISKFEDEFCKFLGLGDGHAVALSSGTAARYLGLWALAASGKKVAIPAYSSSLRRAVNLIGASILALDLEAGSVNADLSQAATANADILLIAHMFGMPASISPQSGKKIIEDCSQSLGAKVRGAHVGLAGDIAVYSFNCDQIITTGGQGGMLVAKDRELADKVRHYRDHANGDAAFNFKLTDIQAAIGRVQLEKLPKLLARREDIFNAYLDSGFKILEQKNNDLIAVRQAAILQTDHAQSVISRLKEACIECVVPVDSLSESEMQNCPLAAKMSQSTVSLPIHPHLSNDEVREIMEQLHDTLALVSRQS